MLRSIQVLRALAALLVVFAHFEYTEPAVGRFGVDIFFVISGFIMAHIVNKSPEDFLYRRIIRIVPLYYLMTLFTTGLYLFKPSWFRNVVLTPTALIKSLLFIPYHIKDSGPILTLGWTLNYEMFFYLSIAVFIFIFGNKKGMIACLIGLSLFVLVSSFVTWNSYVVRYWGSTMIMEFVGGAILYYFWKHFLSSAGQSVRNVLAVVGFAALGFLMYAEYKYGLSTLRFLLIGGPSLLVACGFLSLENRINPQNKIHSTMVLLGDSSYAMYLLHPFVIYAFLRLVYVRLNLHGPVFDFLGLVFSLALVCLLSVALHKWFEKPMVSLLKSILDKQFAFAKKLTKSRLRSF
ncbi:Peptidoglycan/LPS O-acetylase OafA/YrhL, contains acyltransferase and SGNH-hydrolase domains [Dyadobacter soli]|uniref:Peptidoglycan/LPS O-acetylase OafA/YrhL, contains acyltransferase and SGNH-hydrolase domains n=1 Tax=Dyadobacter soli TaxID=659014 RepID=A0A1G7BS57_9BACT|nr:acyltransferase [Dyadobacter soli]SDE29817.1 Peptidoglycan/LPS O-acetylase OafA/YrhL, contains acyltransferase and SGNH-hydrolase domains [Dyadobacter soli]